MFSAVKVIGRGRVGGAVHARLSEQGLAAGGAGGKDADLVLLCVPDSAIADAAAAILPGPWIAHVSGATPLTALAGHERRFGLHPLQTFTRARGPEQLDGAWGAVTAEHDAARERAHWLAGRLGLRPFDIRDESRVLYHAGAAMASNFLVTLYRAAARLLETRRRAARGAAAADAAHHRQRLRADRAHRPRRPRDRRCTPRGHPPVRARSRSALPRDGAGDAAMTTFRTVADLRRALAPRRAHETIALVPTMGALHSGHVALFEAARRRADVVVASIFVNPSQFSDPADLARYPRTEAQDERLAASAGVDVCFAPAADELYAAGFATWVQVDGPAQDLEGAHRPGHFRGVATICTKLFNIVAPHVAFFGQKDAQQVAVIRRLVRDLNLELDIRVVPTVRDRDGLALSSRNVHLSGEERARALAIPRALDAGLSAFVNHADPVAAARAVLSARPGVDIDYVAVADFEGQPTLAIAARVGRTRLIDNVPLDRGGR